MKRGSVEKIDRGAQRPGPDAARFLKRQAARAIRRLGKLLLEDAPRRVRDVTRGWSS